MLPFILYVVAGMTTGIQVLTTFLVGHGHKTNLMELVVLRVASVGCFSLVASAFLSLSVPSASARMALISSTFVWLYYVKEMLAVAWNIAIHGSNYPFAIFIPPLLLGAATLHSILRWQGRRDPSWIFPDRSSPGVLATLRLLLVFAATATLSYLLGVERPEYIDFEQPRRTVTLEMHRRQDVHTAPHERTLVYSGQDENCTAVFKSSAQLAEYIDSFDGRSIPVTVEVFDDPPLRGIILKLGTWSWRRLPAGSLSIQRGSRPGIYGPIKTCFQP